MGGAGDNNPKDMYSNINKFKNETFIINYILCHSQMVISNKSLYSVTYCICRYI